jgi:plastocyanin
VLFPALAESGRVAERRGLEVTLSLIAAVGGTLAAVGGFVIAYHQMSRDEIERSPAIHLACRPEFRLAEIAQGIRPPEETLLLTESGGQWVHVGGKMKGSSTTAAAPEPFARCDVRNFARLPMLNIRIPLKLTFVAAVSHATVTSNAYVDIPGLAPDASWEFSMLNGSSKSLKFAFDRSISVTRVDERKQVTATLFTDERVAELERASAAATVAEVPAKAASFVIHSFSFKPAELHVKAGETVAFENLDDEAHAIVSTDHSVVSGVLNPHSTWRHTFTKTGRYALHCDYHPYMEAVVVVE